ncbi:MAG: YfdX family protein [Bdellovibrionales bacterium]|nr:YfdX family protein [Bdellovibrionales bacterium]
MNTHYTATIPNDISCFKTKNVVLVASVLTVGLLAAVPNNAFAVPKTDQQSMESTKTMASQATDPKLQKLREESSRVLADVAIAKIALLHDMQNDASSHLQSALKEARELERRTEKYAPQHPMKFGKVEYSSENKVVSSWLPLVEDTFVVRSLDELFLGKEAPNQELVDVRAVSNYVAINTRELRERIEAAYEANKKNDYGHAVAYLDEATSSIFRESIESPRPLETARDNLILAKELTRDKNYGSARKALHYAQDIVDGYVGDSSKKNNDEIHGLRNDIREIQTGLAKNDPNLLQRLTQTFERGISKLEAIIPHTKQS